MKVEPTEVGLESSQEIVGKVHDTVVVQGQGERREEDRILDVGGEFVELIGCLGMDERKELRTLMCGDDDACFRER